MWLHIILKKLRRQLPILSAEFAYDMRFVFPFSAYGP